MPRKPRAPEPERYPGTYRTGKDTWCYRLRLPYDAQLGRRPWEAPGGFPSSRAAWEARERRRMDLEARKAPITRQTVSELMDAYLASVALHVDPATRHRYRASTDTYIVPYLGNLRVRELDTAHVRHWITTLATTGKAQRDGTRTGLAAATIKLARTLLSAALGQAVADGRLDRNPVTRSVRVPTIAPREPVVLSGNALARFIAVASVDEYAAYWLTALYSAMRPGELIALMWDDVDLERGVIHVRRTRTHDERGRDIIGDAPKSAAGLRDVPIPPVAVAALRAQRDRMAFRARHRSEMWQERGLVFPGRRGDMLSLSTVNDRLTALCKRAGVPRITPHGLRHTALSLMAAMGESPKVIADRAGHSSVAFTLDRYAHPSGDDQRAATERMAAHLQPRDGTTDSAPR